MPLKDYQHYLDKIQRAIGRAWADSPVFLNLPGRSLACKVDPNYYLAVEPAFSERMAELTQLDIKLVRETLIRTGNIITKGPDRNPVRTIGLTWAGRVHNMRVAFLDAGFIDRALVFYGGAQSGLDLADMSILSDFRLDLDEFFEGKTPLQALAFSE